MRADVNACDCTWGCMDTVEESALKVDSGRKTHCCSRGIKPASAEGRSDALPTELHLHPMKMAQENTPKARFCIEGKEEGVKTSVKTRPKTLWASSYLSKVDIHAVFATSFVCLFSFFYS